jgi:nucleoside-diphosphate-sugar epimerase
MRALITGAGGFVGANLVRHLLEIGDEPIALVRPSGNDWRVADIASEVRIAPVDLRDPDQVLGAVLDLRPEVIYHLAAHGAYSWQNDLDTMLSVNVRATDALLEGARKADARFVHAGSSSEYGFAARATSECDRVRPNSHYAVTKVAATHLCELAAAQYGQHAVTLRLYSIYGPWEEPGRLMPTLVERALDGSYPPLVAPDIARDFVWITDVCDAFVRAAAIAPDPTQLVLNIASGTQTTLRSLVTTTQETFGLRDEPVWETMPGRSWDTTVWVGDPTTTERALGWRASTPLSSGLAAIAAWMSAEPALRRRYRPIVVAAG